MSDTPRTFAVAGRPRPHILALCDALERENAALRELLMRARKYLSGLHGGTESNLIRSIAAALASQGNTEPDTSGPGADRLGEVDGVVPPHTENSVGWIPVGERLPRDLPQTIGGGENFVIAHSHGMTVLANCDKDGQFTYYERSGRWTFAATHWMSLPKPPHQTGTVEK